MVRYFMRVFSFVLLMLPACLVQASSQQLLDELAQSPSVQAAKPIIDALWEAWTNAHMTPKEQDLMQRGLAAMGQGDFILAESTFDDLVGENPDFTEAWNKRATIRFMMGKFEASRSDVFEVLDREPRHFGAISGLGMIYMHLGELDNALQAYRDLQRVFPASPEAQRYIPVLKRQLGLSDL